MRGIKPYTQIYDDLNGQNVLKKIEACGRVCYKSEKKIEEGSDEKFVANIIKRGHEAVLEHGSFIFEVWDSFYEESRDLINSLEEASDFTSFLRFTYDTRPIMSGNVRAWRSFFKAVLNRTGSLPNGVKRFINSNAVLFPEFQDAEFVGCDHRIKPLWATDLQTENEILTHWDVTVKFVVDRGISHELVRHRIASFCQESTRYCNYSKDDFGSEITFIIPSHLAYGSAAWKTWKEAMKASEDAYFKLLDIGLTAQEARAVLPNSLKTEVVMTANLDEWLLFFTLRTASAAHPQMREVTIPLLEDFKTLFPNIFEGVNENVAG
jgi:thymidylate synthase (FAD)